MGNVVLTVVLYLYDYDMTVAVLIITFCSGDDGDDGVLGREGCEEH